MSAAAGPVPGEAGSGVRVFEGKLHRVQRGHGKAFADVPPAQPPDPVRRPARVAIMLALAHRIQEAIDRAVVRDRAEVARRLGLTRARVTQLLDLTLLPPNVQEQALFAESVDGVEPTSERNIRALVPKGPRPTQRPPKNADFFRPHHDHILRD